jgi:transcription elongation factor GreB
MMEKKYISPAGLKRIQDELYQLTHVERPEVTKLVTWAAGNGDRSENADYQYGKRRLREIDRRTRFLLKRIDQIEVVNNAGKDSTKILFGATVIFHDDEENEKTYTFVGIDEVNLKINYISGKSPIGPVLLGKVVGDEVTVVTPQGLSELTILKVSYLEIS